MKKEHCVYALIKDDKAVYIGYTSNIIQRMYSHRLSSKDFDKHIVIKKYKTKKEALIAENSIINFLTLFGSDKFYNAENINIKAKKVMIRDINLNNK